MIFFKNRFQFNRRVLRLKKIEIAKVFFQLSLVYYALPPRGPKGRGIADGQREGCISILRGICVPVYHHRILWLLWLHQVTIFYYIRYRLRESITVTIVIIVITTFTKVTMVSMISMVTIVTMVTVTTMVVVQDSVILQELVIV